ncbi:MAG: BMP family ABC transporter substrate-binding protein [Shackletoniella antarctica]|uniref:BMP family ABC transporter substrate-binding protein n=1 Tax=Shackletoniella antarctica TaxID=268115 RepID=A0A2W4XQ35_9CYAN|nr:MAG: BMP family ABC transporter substrate-binding protein [Shackletoniella antarctica]
MSSYPRFSVSRRQLVRGLLATGAFGATSHLWTGCSSQTKAPGADNATPASSTASLVMGVIYVGPKDDYGWNQAHAEGAAGLSSLAGIKVVEEANVPETTAAAETMRSMIVQDGAQVLFPTSFGYFDPHILALAKEFPEVQFLHCGTLFEEGTHPTNVGSYFGFIDEAYYVAGIVAAHTSKTGKLGFVMAKPIPRIVRTLNSWMLGARSVNPDATTQLIITGAWTDPVKEAEAVNSMADQGVDVVTCNVDNAKVVMETAEKRGIFCSGNGVNQSAVAPKGYLTGAEWDWTGVYTSYAKLMQEGKTLMNQGIPHLYLGGLGDNFVKLSPYGAPVGEAAKADADRAKAGLIDGSLVVYQGEIKDNTGAVVIPAGTEYKPGHPELEKMDWLVAGVQGQITG